MQRIREVVALVQLRPAEGREFGRVSWCGFQHRDVPVDQAQPDGAAERLRVDQPQLPLVRDHRHLVATLVALYEAGNRHSALGQWGQLGSGSRTLARNEAAVDDEILVAVGFKNAENL